MMENADSEQQPAPEIFVDDDWKSRVKAEDQALDEKLKAEQQETDSSTQEEPPEIDPSQIPPASLSTLLTMLSTQAMLSLGLFPNPASGKVETQLPLAKHYIDLLGVLEEKTKGNLETVEQQMLENSLHELRMLYLQQSNQ